MIMVMLDMILQKKYRIHCDKIIPNMMTNLERNYDSIVLGELTNIQKFDIEEKTLILGNFYRNLYTDELVMQRFYSYLKRGGTVYFVIDRCKLSDIRSKRISPLDYVFLHDVTLLEHGIDRGGLKYKMLERKAALLLLLQPFIKRKSYISSSSEEYEYIKDRITSFCIERNINCKFVTGNEI